MEVYMFCKNCGAKIEDGQKFCTYCGAKIEKPEESNKSNNTQSGPYISYESLTGHTANNEAVSFGKSRVFAGLLAILVGAGIHNFYLSNIKKAVIQLLIYIVSSVFTFAAQGASTETAYWIFYAIGLISGAVVGIWCLVEGILILTGKIKKDGKGNPIR